MCHAMTQDEHNVNSLDTILYVLSSTALYSIMWHVVYTNMQCSMPLYACVHF